ncbi:hypothetical protein [Actinomadura sp. WMMB 499]|uniref:hypothetical protein n=1 Tax=Actinomadura sp. WMMB 499 TaxID=1219491 RepID=UPI00159E6296|nr:hypothetical protein [Actinomadura sp. WMMB 499]
MHLTRLRGACDPKPTCPTLYLTDRGSFIVQGYIVATAPSRPLPEREAEVEVPVSMLWTSPSASAPNTPAVRLTGHGTAIVRGVLVDDAEALARLSLPEGETAVEVPISLLPEVVPNAL